MKKLKLTIKLVLKSMICLIRSSATACFVVSSSRHYKNNSCRLRRSSLFSSSSSSSSSFDDLLQDVDRLLSEDEEKTKTPQDKSRDSGKDNNDWKQINWEEINNSLVRRRENNSIQQQPSSSPVEQYTIQGWNMYIKRDDLLRLQGSQISGNKARKLLSLNMIDVADFPDYIVSYGGPQSNSMLALAAICNYKTREQSPPSSSSEEEQNSNDDDESRTRKKKLLYYTKKLPRFLRNQPSGNYFRALSLGMEVIELSHDDYKEYFGGDSGGSPQPPIGILAPPDGMSVWVPQGGAFGPMASAGIAVLAKEIFEFWKENGKDRPLSVCVPGGTCSTAVLLHRKMKEINDIMDIEVVVIPCVGDEAYARRQMMSISSQIGASANDIPTILRPMTIETEEINNDNSKFNKNRKPKYFKFGVPDKQILYTFEMLRDKYGILVDLIYGAPSWAVMLRHWNWNDDSGVDNDNNDLQDRRKSRIRIVDNIEFDTNNPLAANREIMYVHSGGLEGINSQLLRYKHAGLIELDQIQLPGKNK